jgi:hypothetical protein
MTCRDLVIDHTRTILFQGGAPEVNSVMLVPASEVLIFESRLVKDLLCFSINPAEAIAFAPCTPVSADPNQWNDSASTRNWYLVN